MSEKPIARLTRLPLRELWPNEALSFTRWLSQHLDILQEVIGINLSLLKTEANAGDFSVDILAEDEEGNLAVIENQLEATDHDHLGKLLTYVSNRDAKLAIWITSDPRPEHVKAIRWINEILPEDMGFYLVKLEAVRIGDSPPAPLFSLIEAPSSTGRQTGAQRKELGQTHALRLEFWRGVLEKAKEQQNTTFAHISPSTGSWISAGAGKTGVTWNCVVLKDHARVELYIDTREGERNKSIFDALFKHRDEIEASFGEPLEWQRLDESRASRVAYPIRGLGGLSDRERWTELQEAIVSTMARFENAIKPHLSRIR
ncbi:MAG: DUF4268 domain-containing protein [Thermoflexales bacterium]|nr:DUF4268 domain-containing protein [Thermoflexales bacterium]MCS7323791.1 DUF4268 domain-containing protein [Thermoflexales bacterium]MCX7938179.1 DUF4268 domain-containing protein [Thermoflexales bacterium]MDW8053899.1 DUF4268 domain-containing protein [Anaerolineae bacterium]MDW8292440.1 DUF4268 domain-containing protein [Anaerolineae bacterium]